MVFPTSRVLAAGTVICCGVPLFVRLLALLAGLAVFGQTMSLVACAADRGSVTCARGARCRGAGAAGACADVCCMQRHVCAEFTSEREERQVGVREREA